MSELLPVGWAWRTPQVEAIQVLYDATNTIVADLEHRVDGRWHPCLYEPDYATEAEAKRRTVAAALALQEPGQMVPPPRAGRTMRIWDVATTCATCGNTISANSGTALAAALAHHQARCKARPVRLLEFTLWHQDALPCSDCGALLRFATMGRAEVIEVVHAGKPIQVLRPICDACARTARYRDAVYL